MAKKNLIVFWLPIILAVIGLISAVIVALINNLPIFSSSPNSFDYQVRVETKSGDPIANAGVMLEIGGGKAPLDSIADSAGLARIFVDGSYVGKPGRLIVKATGYKEHTQNIDLTEGDLPKTIQLDPVP